MALSTTRRLLAPLAFLAFLPFLPFIHATRTPLHVTGENYTKAGQANTPTIIFFYAPWCGHCKAFHPVFDELAYHPKTPPAILMKADASNTSETFFQNKYGIGSYPTVLYFPNVAATDVANANEYAVYGGKKTVAEIQHFMLFQQATAADGGLIALQTHTQAGGQADVQNHAAMDMFRTVNEQCRVTVTAPKGGAVHSAVRDFQSTAFGSAMFVDTTVLVGFIDNTHADDAEDTVVVENLRDGTTHTLDGASLPTKSRATRAVEFIFRHGSPNVPGVHMAKYYQGMFGRVQGNEGDVVKKFACVVGRYREMRDVEAVVGIMKEVAGVMTVWIDSSEHREFLDRYKLTEDMLPVVLLVDVSGGIGTSVTKMLAMQSPSSAVESDSDASASESMEDWWVRNLSRCFDETYLEGNKMCDAKPRAGSHPAKKSNMNGSSGTKTLVGKNLNLHVYNSTIDQFVLFTGVDDLAMYQEQYRQFGRRFKVDWHVDFYEIEVGGENDVPMKSVNIEFTPALYFFGAGAKDKPILFKDEGAFTGENLIEWLDKVVTKPFTGVIDNQQHGRRWQKVVYNIKAFFTRGPWKWYKNVMKGEYDDVPLDELKRRLEERSGEL